MNTALTDAERKSYAQDGYLIFDRLLPTAECDALLARMRECVAHPIEGVAIQMEPAIERGEVPRPSDDPVSVVRKIEKLVERDELFLSLAKHPLIFPRIQAILGPHIRLFRDALMMKPARHGSEKPYHQDSAYWNVEPMDLCSIWVALEEATPENGCMRVIPGSHKQGLIEHQHLRDFMVTDDYIDYGKEVSVPLQKGGALFFHSLLLHATAPNTSNRSRCAMVVSYMDADSRWTGKPEDKPHFVTLS